MANEGELKVIFYVEFHKPNPPPLLQVPPKQNFVRPANPSSDGAGASPENRRTHVPMDDDGGGVGAWASCEVVARDVLAMMSSQLYY